MKYEKITTETRKFGNTEKHFNFAPKAQMKISSSVLPFFRASVVIFVF